MALFTDIDPEPRPRRRGGWLGWTILGALILTVLDSLLTILNASQAVRQMLYGLIILALAAIYARAAAAD